MTIRGIFAKRRTLVGSDLTIVLAIILHVAEAIVIALTRVADGSVGVGTLVAVFEWPYVAAAVLVAAAMSAAVGQWADGLAPHVRLLLLVPQQTLLLITALGAIYAVARGIGADGVERSWIYILCNQAHRIGMPMLYSAAILARVREP